MTFPEEVVEKAAAEVLSELGGLPDELESMHLNAARAVLAVVEEHLGAYTEYGVRCAGGQCSHESDGEEWKAVDEVPDLALGETVLTRLRVPEFFGSWLPVVEGEK